MISSHMLIELMSEENLPHHRYYSPSVHSNRATGKYSSEHDTTQAPCWGRCWQVQYCSKPSHSFQSARNWAWPEKGRPPTRRGTAQTSLGETSFLGGLSISAGELRWRIDGLSGFKDFWKLRFSFKISFCFLNVRCKECKTAGVGDSGREIQC
jgi:hypothetical protein